MELKLLNTFTIMKNIFYIAVLLIAFITGCQEEPAALSYSGFEIEMSKTEYFVDKGTIFTFECEVTCENGIKEYQVAVPAWNSDMEEKVETVQVTGSPKKYKIQHSLSLPDNIELEQCDLVLTVYDYSGESVNKTITVKIKTDTTKPELLIVTPENGGQYSPKEDLMFDLTAKDELKIKSVTIQCEALDFYKEYTSEMSNSLEIKVNDNMSLEGLSGEYTFVITATDAQDNSTSQEVKVIVTIPSKPGIFKVDGTPYCGVSGGILKLVYDIETSYDCTITNVNIKSEGLGIDKNISETGQSEYRLNETFDIDESVEAKQFPVKITVTNSKGEETVLNDNCRIINKLYIIGRGTLAREKEGKAIEMTRCDGDKSCFEITTYIEKVGDGVKFLSAQSWNELNLGIGSDDKIINSGSSKYITTPETGYYKFTFNGATWEYTSERIITSSSAEHEHMYIFGSEFLYDENGEWKTQEGWNSVMPEMIKYQDNPHRFYLDVKTGTNDVKAYIKFAAQNDISDGGVFYGMQETSNDQEVWWEYVGKIYKFTKAGDTPNMCEKSRNGEVMRIVIDTYLAQMSWMPIDQYQ